MRYKPVLEALIKTNGDYPRRDNKANIISAMQYDLNNVAETDDYKLNAAKAFFNTAHRHKKRRKVRKVRIH